jgi:hypothetical protein
MGFVIVPVDSSPTTKYSQPDRVSFVVADDGGGGQILLNGLGITSGSVANAVDLATLFGTAFRSIPLLRAFKVTASAQAACDQFFQNLNIQINAIGGTGTSTMPSVSLTWGVGGGPANAPYLIIIGPAVVGEWRVDLQLRHSLPG